MTDRERIKKIKVEEKRAYYYAKLKQKYGIPYLTEWTDKNHHQLSSVLYEIYLEQARDIRFGKIIGWSFMASAILLTVLSFFWNGLGKGREFR